MPSHLVETLAITRKIAKKSRFIFLSNENNRAEFEKIQLDIACSGPSVEFFAIEDIPESMQRKNFRTNSALDRNFRDGFWFHASNRFLILADYIEYAKLENIVHIENDYVLYFDPTDKLEAFRTYADFSVPLDRVRAIPGFVWIKNGHVAKSLADFILKNDNKDDMETVGQFCLSSDDLVKKPLPTLPYEYSIAKGLSIDRFSAGIDQFGGIFDAAAIGQYIGGIHWMNNPMNTTFFINESSDLNLSETPFSWGVENGIRHPFLSFNNVVTPILGVHAHSKDLEALSPFNHGVPLNESDLITGEKIQAICDLTIGAPSITKFHGRNNIKSAALIELPEDPSGNLLPPSNDLIERVIKAKTIFVYTHLIPYFKYFLAPRFISPYTLVSHNSDHPATIVDYQLLNQPHLKSWYSQNCEFAHTKLKPLPIGLQNIQWGPEKISQLIGASKKFHKEKFVYANFSAQTHPSRAEVLSAARDLKGITIESGLNYQDYLKSLASHKFCLCPRGNGIDTHRFWEAQYLDCIPIILWRDWTPAYSGLPVLILDNWGELKELDLEKIYIDITCKRYSRTNLFFKNIVDQISND